MDEIRLKQIDFPVGQVDLLKLPTEALIKNRTEIQMVGVDAAIGRAAIEKYQCDFKTWKRRVLIQRVILWSLIIVLAVIAKILIVPR